MLQYAAVFKVADAWTSPLLCEKVKWVLSCRVGKRPAKSGNFGDCTMGLMEQHSSAEPSVLRNKGENEGRKEKPAEHSPKDTHFLSTNLTQQPGERGGWGPFYLVPSL